MITPHPYPSFIKYMGSKSKIIEFVVKGINEARSPGDAVLDLFAGSASLAGSIGRQVPFHSNDIQNYSGVLANAYVSSWKAPDTPSAEELIKQSRKIVGKHRKKVSLHIFEYPVNCDLATFNTHEKVQRELINVDFNHEWHLFLKYYSGTWWSTEQCLWIDAIRQIAETYKSHPVYDVILSSLMFAMAYCSQGTGHYAQYRDAKSTSSMKDILLYRKRDIVKYFSRKYDEALNHICNNKPQHKFKCTADDFSTCLQNFQGGVVYADPPYCFVHYSRFYHALETLVLYDYPELQVKGDSVVKGRYRIDRHQSPFCISSKVEGAFQQLFSGVKDSRSKLVLSYSNTGMITLEHLADIASSVFSNASIERLTIDHQHMTLGRTGVRHRDVKECLLLIK